MPEKTTEELLQKLQNLLKEVEVLEYRIKNIGLHITEMEESIAKIKESTLEGFHIVNKKLSDLEREIHELINKKSQ